MKFTANILRASAAFFIGPVPLVGGLLAGGVQGGDFAENMVGALTAIGFVFTLCAACAACGACAYIIQNADFVADTLNRKFKLGEWKE